MGDNGSGGQSPNNTTMGFSQLDGSARAGVGIAFVASLSTALLIIWRWRARRSAARRVAKNSPPRASLPPARQPPPSQDRDVELGLVVPRPETPPPRFEADVPPPAFEHLGLAGPAWGRYDGVVASPGSERVDGNRGVDGLPGGEGISAPPPAYAPMGRVA